jgi:hypothetical protein
MHIALRQRSDPWRDRGFVELFGAAAVLLFAPGSRDLEQRDRAPRRHPLKKYLLANA